MRQLQLLVDCVKSEGVLTCYNILRCNNESHIDRQRTDENIGNLNSFAEKTADIGKSPKKLSFFILTILMTRKCYLSGQCFEYYEITLKEKEFSRP